MFEMVEVNTLCRKFESRTALADVSFTVGRGEYFGLLGPNGSGKTTLFRVLTTLLAPTSGSARVAGCDVVTQRNGVRGRIGVVFQSPSLDLYLTTRENLRYAGLLYGLGGRDISRRIDAALGAVGLADRADDLVRVLSGGLRRRVEVAKSMLHQPRVLILDEPDTGLDPAARRDLGDRLRRLAVESGVTILLTTHILEEAERCDRLAILDRGRLAACGSPAELKARIGGDCVTIETREPAALAAELNARLDCRATVLDDVVRIESAEGPRLVSRVMECTGDRLTSITLGKPTLGDVFMRETGRRFEEDGASAQEAA